MTFYLLMTTTFNKYITQILGPASAFTLGQRTLNAMSVLAVIVAVVDLSLYQQLELPKIYFLTFSYIAPTVMIAYYLNRFRRKYTMALILFISAELVIFYTDFFHVGGVNGPGPILIIFFHIVNFNLLEKGHHLFYLIFCNIFVALACAFNIYHTDISPENLAPLNARALQIIHLNLMSSVALWLFKKQDYKKSNALKAINKHLQQLLHSVENDFIIMQVDALGNLSYVSDASKTILRNLPEGEAHQLLYSLVNQQQAEVISERKLYINGSAHCVRINQKQYFDAQQQPYLQLIIQDISDQKKYEKQLILALNKEYELNKMKSDFITMVSHQFRTPLTTIHSANQLIQYQITEKTPEDAPIYQPRFNQVFEAVGSLKGMLERLLDYGQMETEEINLYLQQQDFPAFIEDILKRRYAAEDCARIRFKVVGTAQTIEFDAYLMEHIIVNLLNNALKYSEEAIDLHLEYHASKVQLGVRDFGIGISEEAMQHLFQPFYRAKNAENTKGTGMGLHFVKKYAALHGGSIAVQRHPEGGAHFTLELPCRVMKTIRKKVNFQP